MTCNVTAGHTNCTDYHKQSLLLDPHVEDGKIQRETDHKISSQVKFLFSPEPLSDFSLMVMVHIFNLIVTFENKCHHVSDFHQGSS